MSTLHHQIKQWFAVYTKYRCEKSVLRELSSKHINAYVPIKVIEKKYGYNRRLVELPLISCYVFVKICKSEYVSVLETDNVINYVKFGKDLIPIPEKEIDILKQSVKDIKLKTTAEPRFYQGDIVEVTAGHLKGMEGKLVELKGKKVFVVELKKFGYSLLMEINPAYLKKRNLVRNRY